MTQKLEKLWGKFIAEDLLVLIGAVTEVFAISLIFKIPLRWDFVVLVLLLSAFQYFYDSIKEGFKIKFAEKKFWQDNRFFGFLFF